MFIVCCSISWASCRPTPMVPSMLMMPRWLVPLLTALLAAVIAVAVFHWLSDDDDVIALADCALALL